MSSADADWGIPARISFAASIHSGPRNPSSSVPRDARYERIIDLALISFTTSLRPICSEDSALSAKGDESSPSTPEASRNSPGDAPVATSSLTLRMRFPVRLSLTVPRVTSMSVAPNASGGMPMSKTILW